MKKYTSKVLANTAAGLTLDILNEYSIDSYMQLDVESLFDKGEYAPDIETAFAEDITLKDFRNALISKIKKSDLKPMLRHINEFIDDIRSDAKCNLEIEEDNRRRDEETRQKQIVKEQFLKSLSKEQKRQYEKFSC
jgi:hypothetical protein